MCLYAFNQICKFKIFLTMKIRISILVLILMFIMFGSCSKFTIVTEKYEEVFVPVIENFISQNSELKTKSGNLFKNKILMDSLIISKRYYNLKIPYNREIDSDFHPIYRPDLRKLLIGENFQIELFLSIDKNGNIAYVDILHENTNLFDKTALKSVLNYVFDFKFPRFTQNADYKCIKYKIITDFK